MLTAFLWCQKARQIRRPIILPFLPQSKQRSLQKYFCPSNLQPKGRQLELENQKPLADADGEEVDFLCELVGSNEKERTDMELENAGMKQEMANMKKEIADMKQEMANMKQEIADMKQEIADMKQEIADMKQEIADMKQEIADMKQEIADMKQEIADMNLEKAGMKLTMLTFGLQRSGGDIGFYSGFPRYLTN